MQYLEEYVNWLKDENQALYDELSRKEKENENLRKKIKEYKYKEELFKEAELLKKKSDSFDRLINYINELQGIYDD